MPANVIVTGLPIDATFQKLVYTFRVLFKKIQIKRFWIRDLSEAYGADEKQMTVELNNASDARKARNYLDNLPFPHPGNKQHLLSAQLDDGSMNHSMESMEYLEDWNHGHERRRRPAKRDRARPRSPSPGYRSEASKLDLEIELLRKQRQVIEEERRLLLERKKLDMIREYGPSASQDFDDFDDSEPPPKRRRNPAPPEVKKPRNRSPPPPKPNPRNANSIPLFFQPCKKLIAEMKQFIEQDGTPEEREILIKLIRAAIRKNLAIALEGKQYMPTPEIIKLYRERHPQTGDEVFVTKILANIRASYLPDELESKLARAKKDAKTTGNESRPVKMEKDEGKAKMDTKDKNSLGNPSDDKNGGNSKENQKVNDETESQDKPANGENETDPNPTDVSSDVNAEIDTSQNENNTVVISNDTAKDLPKVDGVDEKSNNTVEELTPSEGVGDKSNNTVEELTPSEGVGDKSNNTVEELTPPEGVGDKSNNTVEELTPSEGVGEKSNNTVEELPKVKAGVKTDESVPSTVTEDAVISELVEGNAE